MTDASSDADPVRLLFGGMAKLGPGSDADTAHVLGLLPGKRFRLVVDAGCGTGRQTLVLARALGIPVDAVDCCQAFLDQLAERAQSAHLGPLVRTHCMDMRDIPQAFRDIDLLWAEGSAYNIGFATALETWASALSPRGFVVASELCWLTEEAPYEARMFFQDAYPDMRSMRDNAALAQGAGYELLAMHTLAPEAWTEGYYDSLGPRARTLLGHPAAAVREFAAETLREIEVFERSAASYGYVFYVLRKRN